MYAIIGGLCLVATVGLLVFWLWKQIDNGILVRCVDTEENRAIVMQCENIVGRERQSWTLNDGGEFTQKQECSVNHCEKNGAPAVMVPRSTYPVRLESARVNDHLMNSYFDDIAETSSEDLKQLEINAVKKTHLCMKPILAQVLFSENWRKLAEKNLLPYERHLIHTPDGGTFSVEWWPKKPDPKEPLSDDKPVILLGHGIGGSHRSHYLQHLIRHLNNVGGYTCAVMVRRGCGGLNLTSQHLNNDVTDIEDLKLALEHIESQIGPKTPLFGVSFSFGAMQLSRYLAETNGKHRFLGCCFVSIPWCLHEMNRGLAKHFVSNRLGVRNLRKVFLKKENRKVLIRNETLDLKRALQTVDVIEWSMNVDFHVHRVKHESLENYYTSGSPKKWINKIKNCKIMCISSFDDPLCPKVIQESMSLYCRNPDLFFVNTEYGSHGSLLDRYYNHKTSWHEELIAQFIGAVREQRQRNQLHEVIG